MKGGNGMSRIQRVLDQVRWDFKRGAITVYTIDHILDTAERILTDEEYEIFSGEREYLDVYQSA